MGEYEKSIVSINLVAATVGEFVISVMVRILIKVNGTATIKELWYRVWPVIVGIVVLVMGIGFVGKIFY